MEKAAGPRHTSVTPTKHRHSDTHWRADREKEAEAVQVSAILRMSSVRCRRFSACPSADSSSCSFDVLATWTSLRAGPATRRGGVRGE